MDADIGDRGMEQFGHERLREPDRLILHPHLDVVPSILRPVEDDFGLLLRVVWVFAQLLSEHLGGRRHVARHPKIREVLFLNPK